MHVQPVQPDPASEPRGRVRHDVIADDPPRHRRHRRVAGGAEQRHGGALLKRATLAGTAGGGPRRGGTRASSSAAAARSVDGEHLVARRVYQEVDGVVPSHPGKVPGDVPVRSGFRALIPARARRLALLPNRARVVLTPLPLRPHERVPRGVHRVRGRSAHANDGHPAETDGGRDRYAHRHVVVRLVVVVVVALEQLLPLLILPGLVRRHRALRGFRSRVAAGRRSFVLGERHRRGANVDAGSRVRPCDADGRIPIRSPLVPLRRAASAGGLRISRSSPSAAAQRRRDPREQPAGPASVVVAVEPAGFDARRLG